MDRQTERQEFLCAVFDKECPNATTTSTTTLTPITTQQTVPTVDNSTTYVTKENTLQSTTDEKPSEIVTDKSNTTEKINEITQRSSTFSDDDFVNILPAELGDKQPILYKILNRLFYFLFQCIVHNFSESYNVVCKEFKEFLNP